jgi:putative chitinase
MSRTLEGLRALGPNGKKAYIEALAEVADSVLNGYAINTPLRVAHFWAQISHECGGFKAAYENLNYSAARLLQVFPKYFPTMAHAVAVAGQPEKIANKVYGGRLGNKLPDDGWRYRGRGPVQLTGRDNYREMGEALNIDLINKPDLAADPVVGLRIACVFWTKRGLNALADKNDIKAITKRINGGYNGLADRKANFVIAWRIWGGGVERPAPKPLTKSKELAAGAGAAVGGTAGVGAAWEAGKEAAKHAGAVKDAANEVGTAVGSTGSTAILVGALIIFALGVGYLIYRRIQRNKHEEV